MATDKETSISPSKKYPLQVRNDNFTIKIIRLTFLLGASIVQRTAFENEKIENNWSLVGMERMDAVFEELRWRRHKTNAALYSKRIK